jgi:hypothetical protein
LVSLDWHTFTITYDWTLMNESAQSKVRDLEHAFFAYEEIRWLDIPGDLSQ